MRLILVRHGQTDSNVRMTYCGRFDRELNSEGIRQVRQTAEDLEVLLHGEPVQSMQTSPLKRATSTADIIAERLGYPKENIVLEPEIIEMSFGIFEDLTYDEIRERFPQEHRNWEKDWITYQVPEGESNEMVNTRMERYFKQFIENHDDGNHIFTTHMGALTHALVSILELDIRSIWRFRLRNAGIAVIHIGRDKFGYLERLF